MGFPGPRPCWSHRSGDALGEGTPGRWSRVCRDELPSSWKLFPKGEEHESPALSSREFRASSMLQFGVLHQRRNYLHGLDPAVRSPAYLNSDPITSHNDSRPVASRTLCRASGWKRTELQVHPRTSSRMQNGFCPCSAGARLVAGSSLDETSDSGLYFCLGPSGAGKSFGQEVLFMEAPTVPDPWSSRSFPAMARC